MIDCFNLIKIISIITKCNFFLDLGNYKSSSNLIGMLVIVFKKELLVKVVRHQVSQVKKYKGV